MRASRVKDRTTQRNWDKERAYFQG